MQGLSGPSERRDRDATGRPRNARVRDRLGRPLARSAGSAEAEDEPALPPAEALVKAQQLLDAGAPFTAHEVLEAVWKAPGTAGEERGLWRGLAQLAVGVTHGLRGNQAGARALLDRAAESLAGFAGSSPYDVDVDGLRSWAASTAADAAALEVLPRLTRPGGAPGTVG
ncbi:MAG TPA: DUF309 domain-containing protein [Mycobacteriales bacterium]|nr:DUF309 domain-containing protein [Mycobacteriales bacterium]